MPTPREREYYRMGFQDGYHQRTPDTTMLPTEFSIDQEVRALRKRKPKRKLSAWNKFVRANSNKPRFQYRDGKLNLKKMGVAFRKTPAGKKKK
jgi:hypothetical protein|tara:strand:+ start:219 stop:497 length:279 start_codon:yes stop_codon:yes gene_type:complete